MRVYGRDVHKICLTNNPQNAFGNQVINNEMIYTHTHTGAENHA